MSYAVGRLAPGVKPAAGTKTNTYSSPTAAGGANTSLVLRACAAAADNFSVAVSASGITSGAIPDADIHFDAAPIAANQTVEMLIELGTGEMLWVWSSGGNVRFNVNGQQGVVT